MFRRSNLIVAYKPIKSNSVLLSETNHRLLNLTVSNTNLAPKSIHSKNRISMKFLALTQNMKIHCTLRKNFAINFPFNLI